MDDNPHDTDNVIRSLTALVIAMAIVSAALGALIATGIWLVTQ